MKNQKAAFKHKTETEIMAFQNKTNDIFTLKIVLYRRICSYEQYGKNFNSVVFQNIWLIQDNDFNYNNNDYSIILFIKNLQNYLVKDFPFWKVFFCI